MAYFVYMILSQHKNRTISYVGYTTNVQNRLIKHNNSKGAKFTKGKKWDLIYYKKYSNKSDAMKNEYKLKKNYKLRNEIKNIYILNE
jgi:putative endonuclease